MKVVLLEKVGKLGNMGDIVSVKRGFGRNYLIPKGAALHATEGNIAYFEQKKAAMLEEDKKLLDVASKLLPKIDQVFITLIRQAGEDGRLFGSVPSKEIAEILSSQSSTEISKANVNIFDPIKYLGIYEVEVNLHPEVIAKIRVNVARSEAEAAEAKKEFLSPAKKKDDSKDELGQLAVTKAEDKAHLESIAAAEAEAEAAEEEAKKAEEEEKTEENK